MTNQANTVTLAHCIAGLLREAQSQRGYGLADVDVSHEGSDASIWITLTNGQVFIVSAREYEYAPADDSRPANLFGYGDSPMGQ